MMLQQPQGDDYVIAMGENRSVSEFLDMVFGLVGLNWQDYVVVDPVYFRPVDVDGFLGDSSKAREKLGWEPRTSFEELAREMVIADLKVEGLDPGSHGL